MNFIHWKQHIHRPTTSLEAYWSKPERPFRGILTSSHRSTRPSGICLVRSRSPERPATGKMRRQRTLRSVQSLDETAPFELIDYRWIGEACSTDSTFNSSPKISTWLTSSNGT